MQLLKRLSLISLSNRWHLYLIFVILIIFSFYYWYLWFIVILYFIRVKRYVNLFLLLIMSSILYCGLYFININEYELDGEFMIIERKQIDTYYVYTVTHQFKNYQMTLNQSYELGSLLILEAQIEPYKMPTIPGGFDSKTYYLGQNIHGRLRFVSIKNVSDNHIMVDIYQLIDWNHPLILLIKDQTILDLNLYSFLFTLSSVHLTLIILLIRKWMYYLDIKNHQKQQIIAGLMSVLFLIGGSMIILRVAIINILKYVVKEYKWSISKLDIECMTTIIIILLLPYVIFNQTFILISLFVFFNQLKVIRSSLSQHLLIPLILIPFMLSWNHEIAVLTFFMIPIVMRLAKFVLVPSIILFILFPFTTLIPMLEQFLNQSLSFFDFKFDRIYLPTLPWYGIILYLFILIWIYSAYNRKVYYKRLSSVLFLLLIGFFLTFMPRNDEVIFLDVGQGDAAVIFKNQKTIVVDAFGDVESYLKYRHIRTIDYLILTHSDQDHIKNAQNLLDKFAVNHLVLSGYLDYQLKHSNITDIDSEHLFSLDDVNLTFLAPIKSYSTTNECSVVFRIDVNQQRYLFTGDISTEVENDLINRYGNTLDVDILKVAHHGSSTSSSLRWLNITSPTYAVMSVATYNIYGFPDQNIVDRYRSLGIYLYLTSKNGSILFTENEVRMFS